MVCSGVRSNAEVGTRTTALRCLVVAALSASCSFAATAWALSLRDAARHSEEAQSSARDRFLAMWREKDSTELADEYSVSSLALSEETLEAVLAERRNIRGLFFEGEDEWLDTIERLDDPDFVSEGGLRCAARHGRRISTCFYRMSTVVQPTSDGFGSVVHAESELVDPRESPDPGASNHADCAVYAGCLAHVRVGEVVPIPRREKDLFAVEEMVHATQAKEELFRPDKIVEMIGQFESAIRWYEANGTTAADELKRRKLANTASYLRSRLTLLRQDGEVK